MKGNFLYKRLGDRIINERKVRNYTQERLAFRCNIDRTYLARIEEGKANPSIRILNKISRELNIKMCSLFADV